jgi:sulfide:quinone oxidoreductase
MDAALRLREALGDLQGGRIVVAVIATPYKCPAAPHEACLLLHERLTKALGEGEFSIAFMTPEPQPMPVAGAAVGAVVRALYEARAIGTRFGVKPLRVHSPAATPAGSPPTRPVAGELEMSDGSRESFDLLIVVPAHVAPAFLRDSGLLGENGWVPVERGTLATRFENIWAIGDVSHVSLANGGMLPKAGVFARAEGEVVARAVAARLLGKDSPTAFDGRGGCYLETGNGEAAYAEGEFFHEPAPAVTLAAPSKTGLTGKEKFAADWRRMYETR